MSRFFIYSRVSTADQTTAGQLNQIKSRYPEAEIFAETASGVKNRPILNALIDDLKPGDTLIVAALDRLARNAKDLLTIAEKLQKKDVRLISIREDMNFSGPTGKMLLTVMAAVAELELNVLRQRTRDSLAAIKASGRQLGRPRTIPQEKWDQAFGLIASGVSIRKTSAAIGISDRRLRVELRRTRDLEPKQPFGPVSTR